VCNWPVLVIIFACVAIVIAIASMVLQSDGASRGGKRQLMPAPAPDRMETSPKGTDPWSGATPPQATPDPRAMPDLTPDPAPQPRVTPDPPKPPDPSDDDLFGQLGQSSNYALMLTFASQACKHFASCPGTDQVLQGLCDGFARMPLTPIPTGCAAAQACVGAIDQLPCDDASDPLSTVQLLQDCTRAMTEC